MEKLVGLRVSSGLLVMLLATACGEGGGGGTGTPIPEGGLADAGAGGGNDLAAPVPADAARADGTIVSDTGGTVDVLPGDRPGTELPAEDAMGTPPDSAGGPAPATFIPKPRGTCPEFAPGMITVRPGSITRQARLWITPAAAQAMDGPLVFYWYGTNGVPAQAEQALGAETIAAITAQGGMVVAPLHDPAAGIWPWFLVAGTQDLDLQVADEILACAVEKVGVDRRRIHAAGFSAGAIHTVQMSYRRSGYIASVVSYSGAKGPGIPDQDPSNKLAAMIFHGGPGDRVVISFQEGSELYRTDLRAAGRFALMCNHGMGHRIPPAVGPSVLRFLQDHPHGASPSPWAAALPTGVPAYCVR